MPSLILAPESSRKIAALQETVSTLKPVSTQSRTLIPGEMLNALVIGKDSAHGVRLQIKNSTIVADSQIPLHIGEKLTVRVDQISPSVVLKIVNRHEEDLKSRGFVKFFRSNPQALKEFLDSAIDFSNLEKNNDSLKYISKKDFLAISKLVNQIVISKDNLSNPLYLKDSVSALGMTFEKSLLTALSNPMPSTEAERGPTLKEILLKLSSELQSVEATGNSTRAEPEKGLEKFSNFVNSGLQVIESLQVVNVLSQGQDQLFVFQIPFQFADGIRMQDIFLEPDAEGSEKTKGKQCRVVLFVDMDALGELAVDAGVKDGNFRCTIKCQSQEVHDFIMAFLPELQKKLSSVGYTDPTVWCSLDKDLPAWKQAFLQDYRLFSENTINLSV